MEIQEKDHLHSFGIKRFMEIALCNKCGYTNARMSGVIGDALYTEVWRPGEFKSTFHLAHRGKDATEKWGEDGVEIRDITDEERAELEANYKEFEAGYDKIDAQHHKEPK